MDDERAHRQLRLIDEFATLAAGAGIECWLRGGWALDFLLGRITRPHADIDLFVWAADAPLLLRLLQEYGYAEVGGPPPEQQRNLVKAGEELHVTLLKRNELGVVTAGGRWDDSPWPAGMLERPVGRIGDVCCRVISAEAQLWAKEEVPKALGHAPREYDAKDVALLREVLVAPASPVVRSVEPAGAARRHRAGVNEVEPYIQALVERLRQVISADLVGVYLHGSLVLGDFLPRRSDVDAVAVTRRSPSREKKRALSQLLSQRSLPCPARRGGASVTSSPNEYLRASHCVGSEER